ncbi:LicD family protein [Streptococcus oralis]|uniref:Lipopolysaccharide cholinephosphotransferase n=1 Tax=Streptococcus oralis subsp. tigurinus TaxID=1077464 RepID=A0AAX0N6W0_STROR|nr:LicD family protein [Streptococcus oralis]MBS3688451.1 LicD family protein [Streptococcus oralis]MCY7082297.1 LicD family protein [Streptococcus oralis]MCY7105825.1 LicD family protein [Streptococcus oralis]ORO34046.1 lipopolysaccharide cholinephosphotransferase [Streptococcus oralis subsp. tigurinus]
MNFSKMDEYFEKSKLWIAYLFVFISILSMSSLVYKIANPLYKGLSAIVVLYICYTLLFKWKEITVDRKFLSLFGLLAGSHLLSAIFNRSGHLIGNVIEILFMVTYVLLFTMLQSGQLKKLFDWIACTVQIVSFSSAIFAFGLLISRVLILFKIGEQSYYYGVMNGRLWGIVNPNASAIFSYISIILAMYLIHKGSKYSVYLKLNNVIQFVYFATMQSRGALLSLLLMIGLYSFFATRGSIVKRFLTFIVAGLLITATNIGLSYVTSIYISSETATVLDLNKGQSYAETDSSVTKKNGELHLIETTPSGRTYIWKNAIKMGSTKPIFGYGVRNVPDYYTEYFSKFEIQNSLIGGNFHNIFVTIFVSSGVLGLVSFLLVLAYVIKRFLTYLIVSKKNTDKLIMILFFGILFGQLFESQIMYSTNFINIIFWLAIGYGLVVCKRDEGVRYQEVTDVNEIQQMELGIMEYIHEVCQKIGVKYFLAYGSLIGAVRHQGFIPWDDDMDICMLREDYEKLQDYLIANPDERYEVMSYKNNLNYVYPFMKVQDNHTYLLEEDVRIDSNMGIYVDIFPVDGYEDDVEFKNKMTKLIKKRQLSCYTFKGITNTKSVLNSLLRYVSVIIFYFTNTNKYVAQIEELAKSRKVSDYEQVDYLIYKDMNKPVWRREWLEQVTTGTFEGKEFTIPKNYHEILTSDYGDYMQLPPVEQRVSHHDFKLWKIVKRSK